MAAANVPEESLHLVLGGVGVSLLIVFLGLLRARLRALEGEAGALSATAVIGGSVLGAGALVAVALDEPDLTKLLAFPAAVTLAAASIGILRTGALPRWIGYAGFAAAAAQAGTTLAEEAGLVAFAVWAALATVTMLRRPAG